MSTLYFVDVAGTLSPNVHCMQKKTAAIKVRVDPVTKSILIQIAENELLDLSDVVRHALKDFVRKKTDPVNYGDR